MFMLERAIAKGLSVGLSLCPSQSWSRPKRFKISKYTDRDSDVSSFLNFLDIKLYIPEFGGSSQVC